MMRTPYLVLPLLLFSCGASEESPTSGSQSVQPDIETAQQAEITSNQEVMGQAIADAFANELQSSMQSSFDEFARIQEQGGTVEEIAALHTQFDVTAAVTEEEVRASWMAPEGLNGASVESVLTQLAAPSGLEIDFDGVGADLGQACTIETSGMTVMQAFEEVSASVDLIPVYPTGNPYRNDRVAIRFTPGSRPYPIAFAGPFLIQIRDVQENVPYASGRLQLEAVAMVVPQAVHAGTSTMSQYFDVAVIADSQGHSLKEDEDMRVLTQPNRSMNLMRFGTHIDLVDLLGSLESIATVSGQVSIAFPTTVHSLRFTQADQGNQEIENYLVKVKRYGQNSQIAVKGDGADSTVLMWSPVKSNKDPMGIQHQGGYFFDGTLESNVSLPEDPAVLNIKLLETESLSFAFELENIPLKEFASQPKERTALKVEGDHPVSFKVSEFTERDTDFPKVSLVTTSHCNKAIHSIQARFFYTDAQGKDIKDSYTTIQAPMTSMAPTPLVEPGQSSETQQPAFFMPKEATGMRVDVDAIEFMDGSTWIK